MAEFSQKIYKIDSKGKTRVLHVFTEGADLIQESGIVGGKLVQHRSTCTIKNEGRANETSPEEQAQLEAESKIKTKMTTGYFDTIEDAEAKGADVVKPMLAKSSDKEIAKIDWTIPVHIQPKLDGMRCLAILNQGEVTLLSRQGKVIETCQHIIDALLPMAQKSDMILDGEIYAHGKTFQENMRLVKKYRKGFTEGLSYHIYDEISDNAYRQRYRIVQAVVASVGVDCIKRIRDIQISNVGDIARYHGEFIGEGYEGSIIRHSSKGYEKKRSSSLLKHKDFIDIAVELIDVIPMEKRPEHGMAVCKLEDGKTFKANMKMSHDERAAFLVNKDRYIGRTAEIRFFEYSEDGIPRFPVCVGFRLDK